MASDKGSQKRKVSWLVPALSVGYCIAATVMVVLLPTFFDGINNRIYDFKLSMSSLPEPAPQIVHVDVDDAAINKYGLWPWDRSMSAKIVDRLGKFGAKAVAFDVLYTSAGKSAEGNQAFFDAVKETGIVVSAVSMGVTDRVDEQLTLEGDRDRADALYDRSWLLNVPQWYHLLKTNLLRNSFIPLMPVIEYSAGLGHIKATPGNDGVHRKVPLFIRLEDRLVPSLSLATLKVYWKLSPDDVMLRKDGTVQIQRDGRPIRIPVDSETMMLVRWGDIWEAFKHYSVVDVLSDEPDKARVTRYKGKIVVVGVTATGTTDFGVTPMGTHSPMSRTHSHALSTIIMEEFIVRIRAFPVTVMLALILGILFAFVSTRQRLRIGIAVGVAVCAACVAVSLLCFVYLAYDLPMSEFLFIFAPAAFISLSGRAAAIELQASRTSKALERYLSPELLANIVTSGEEPDLSTKRRELTVIFADIEGFSSISETVEVEYINQFLNDFFERMTQAVFEYKGTVDKFLGDGLLAFFGDPISLENHAMAAVKASVSMQEQMGQLNAKWSTSGIADFEKGLRIRIGINTGLIIVGNIGSGRRLEYTVLGSAVNIASRLQSLARPGGIIMTARTKGLIHEEFQCEGPEFVRVKGIDRDIEVYRL